MTPLYKGCSKQALLSQEGQIRLLGKFNINELCSIVGIRKYPVWTPSWMEWSSLHTNPVPLVMSARASCRARVLGIPAQVVVDLLPGLLAHAALVSA